MSEPGAGSDLAALSTRAVLDGDHFVVNGQKVWTSGAHDADVLLTFVRTDPAAPSTRGSVHYSSVPIRPACSADRSPRYSTATVWTSTKCSSPTYACPRR